MSENNSETNGGVYIEGKVNTGGGKFFPKDSINGQGAMDIDTPKVGPVEFPYRMADRIGPMRFSEELPDGKALYVYDPEPEISTPSIQSPDPKSESQYPHVTTEKRHVETGGGLRIETNVNTGGHDFVGGSMVGNSGSKEDAPVTAPTGEIRQKGFFGRGVTINGQKYKTTGFDSTTGETILVPEE